MSNIIYNTFSNYAGSKRSFERFHNQVINMPRDAFATATLNKLQSLASYLLLIEDDLGEASTNYKEIMALIIDKLRDGNYPKVHRNSEFEDRYFRLDKNIHELYESEGRMFRHLMGLCAFFGIAKSLSRQQKIISFDSCRELTCSSDALLIPIFRNILLNCNIKSNDYINNLAGISINTDADYKPAYSIIRFIKEISRPATMFEISILLGRIDPEVQTEKDILLRAIKIAKNLPKKQDDQIKRFFGSLGWKKDRNNLFQYTPSQEPYFKFKTFLLYMEHFDLIEINSITDTVTLTKYSEELVFEKIPIELVDLEWLLYKIDDDEESDNVLADIILRKRSSVITSAIKSDSKLVKKMNKRSLRNIEHDRKGRRRRNKIIAELAKIMADYTCEVTGQKTFKMPNSMYYVEAHHIIEFLREEGPDITDNFLVLGPEKHKLIHHACIEEIDDLYNHLKTNGKIDYARFEKMHTEYRCLTPSHVKFLYNKKLISSMDRDNLLKLISAT